MTCDGANCDWDKTDYEMANGRAQFIAFYVPKSEITKFNSCGCINRDTEVCCQSCKSYGKTDCEGCIP